MLFTDDNLINISDRIEKQFPEFYQEYGPEFIEFVRMYYQWLESDDRPIAKARGLYKQYDIDTTADDFLIHFKQKYMWGIPKEILGNQRLLQKHILELYRSKGSQQGTRLLFRLLFNEDISFYIPSYDIFKLSDNTWKHPHYIETTYCEYFDKLVGNQIKGEQSGAIAVIENYEKRFTNQLNSHILLVSNIQGKFIPNEQLLSEFVDSKYMPFVIGSVTSIEVMGSSSGAAIGDQLTELSNDHPVKVVVSDVYDGTGALNFTIERPGTYYSLDAEFKIYPGVHEDMLIPVVDDNLSGLYDFPKDSNSNTNTLIDNSLYNNNDNIVPDNIPLSGDNAHIKILSIKDTFLYQYIEDIVRDYYDITLDQDFGFPNNPSANINSKIEDSLSYKIIEVGSIDKIQVINPGVNYSSNVHFIPIDPYTSTSGIKDANNQYVGTNGLIIGTPISGQNLIKSVDVISSGYNNNIDIINFSSDNDVTMSGKVTIDGVGFSEGYYDNNKSFLSDDKYLFDGHYYQDFSYVIRASMTLDKYIDILKQLVHSAGNAVYGDIFISVYDDSKNKDVITKLSITDKEPEAFNKGFSKGFS